MAAITKGDAFLAVFGYWEGIEQLCIIVNIYAPQDLVSKRTLWNNLKHLRRLVDGVWVFFGDFNSVRSPDERRGSQYCFNGASEFNHFIYDAELSDLQLGGRRFTYMNKDGSKHSRLDRFLVSMEFVALWSSAHIDALPRRYSDHCPLVVKSKLTNFGPSPFRFFNSWLLDDHLDSIVHSVWNTPRSNRYPDATFRFKLKEVKLAIKEWRKECDVEDRLKVNEAQNTIIEIQLAAESRDLEEEETGRLSDAYKTIYEPEKIKVNNLKQKAKLKWAVDGDENTKFFHGIINNNYRRQNIKGISCDGQWISERSAIKEKAFEFFSNKFSEDLPIRPSFKSDRFLKLSELQRETLECPFSKEEIKLSVWRCGGDKAPGPDGFTFSFINKYWEIIGMV